MAYKIITINRGSEVSPSSGVTTPDFLDDQMNKELAAKLVGLTVNSIMPIGCDRSKAVGMQMYFLVDHA